MSIAELPGENQHFTVVSSNGKIWAERVGYSRITGLSWPFGEGGDYSESDKAKMPLNELIV